MTNATFLENIQSIVNVVKQYGRGIRNDPGTIKEELNAINSSLYHETAIVAQIVKAKDLVG